MFRVPPIHPVGDGGIPQTVRDDRIPSTCYWKGEINTHVQLQPRARGLPSTQGQVGCPREQCAWLYSKEGGLPLGPAGEMGALGTARGWQAGETG